MNFLAIFQWFYTGSHNINRKVTSCYNNGINRPGLCAGLETGSLGRTRRGIGRRSQDRERLISSPIYDCRKGFSSLAIIIKTSKVWRNLKISSQEASERMIYFIFIMRVYFIIYSQTPRAVILSFSDEENDQSKNIVHISGRRWETAVSQKLQNYLNSSLFQ